MLQRDSLFRRRDPDVTRAPQTPPATPPAPSTAPGTSASPTRSYDPVRVDTPKDAKGEERKEAKLIVGPDIKMKGVEVTDCDTLVVEGRIEATLDSRVLQIAQNGVFSGTVAVDNAEIHGRLEGDLTVRKQLVIHATGKVSGKIRYAKIKVEEGAELSGEIEVLDRAAAGASAKRPELAVR
jgi:cytoskeletal protein CcmA (bactofilin family)